MMNVDVKEFVEELHIKCGFISVEDMIQRLSEKYQDPDIEEGKDYYVDFIKGYEDFCNASITV